MNKLLLSLLGIAAISIGVGEALSQDMKGKKVLFVDSYHEGYDWSDGITSGVVNTLKNTGVELKIYRMDTKRNNTEDFKKQAGVAAKKLIDEFKPDVVIMSDDNAAQYLIAPYYKDSKLPFVFCGVNWDASVYGFPAKNITGMIEVNDTTGLLKVLRKISKGDKVGFIADDTETNRKEIENYAKLFNLTVVPYFAKDFADWKKGYVELQSKVDNLIFYNYVAIKDWNPDEATGFIQKNTKIPSGTFQTGPMPYVMVGYLKLPEEQGEWAAKSALKILGGAAPSAIPIAKNEKGNVVINLKVASAAGVEIPYDMTEAASELIK